jgi:hypothetical protein
MYNQSCRQLNGINILRPMKKYIAIAVLLTISGLGFRLFLALRLPNDEPDDGRLYARIAINILEHRSYSIETEEPYTPTYIRVPGYPLFLAGVYAAFGRDNNRAARVAQAVLDTITCWLIALLAVAWAPAGWDDKKRRWLLLIALAMAVSCPFPAIYVTTILTETCTTLLATACALLATLAMRSDSWKRSAALWIAAGVVGGAATLFRPDSGLFAAAVGVTLSLVGIRGVIARRRGHKLTGSIDGRDADRSRRTLARTFAHGVALTIGFVVALAPWTIRNARIFGVFQPIAPQYANMPGEFSPWGYTQWLRTWVDDVKYTESLEFPLDVGPLHIEQVPDYAFDSPEERDRVAALFARYNNPSSTAAPQAEPKQARAPGPSAEAQPPVSGGTAEAGADEESPDESGLHNEEEPDTSEEANQAVEMTPDIDAGFAELARERIARHPLRYYLIVPLKRAASLWFDTHSQYYPFQGELLPLSALDSDIHQQYWLPLFMFLTLLYTALGLAGAWLMWLDKRSRGWLLLLALLIIPRLAFLTSMENPEPRYVVEFFAFVIAAGSIAFTDLIWARLLKLSRNWQRKGEPVKADA